MSVFEKGIG